MDCGDDVKEQNHSNSDIDQLIAALRVCGVHGQWQMVARVLADTSINSYSTPASSSGQGGSDEAAANRMTSQSTDKN
jgi:hypothetical protein